MSRRREIWTAFSIFSQDFVSHFYGNFNTHSVCIIRIKKGDGQKCVIQYYIELYGFLLQSHSLYVLIYTIAYQILFSTLERQFYGLFWHGFLTTMTKNFNCLSLTSPIQKKILPKMLKKSILS